MTEKMFCSRLPVCECDDFQCTERLGLTWEEFDAIKTPREPLIAKTCQKRENLTTA